MANIISSSTSLQKTGANASVSAAPTSDQVASWYRTHLGREPDSSGLQFWSNQVSSASDPNSVRSAFLSAAKANGERVIYPQQTTPNANPITPQLTPGQARDLIERSMLTGVPTATFNQYGGYDAVSKLAQQAGLRGWPRVGLINSLGNQAVNSTYSTNYSYKNHPVPLTKEQFFENAVPKEYIQYLPDSVDDYASLAALAITHDPSNANKTFDEIDWSFLKPKTPVNLGGGDTGPVTYDANTRSVSNNETVQGQLQNVLDPNSPLMRRARAFALAQMAGRGLLNSSLATTAGYTAMIDKALPIAQQDAQTYFTQGLKNQEYLNQAALVNTNWKNEFLKTAYVTQLDFWRQANLAGLQHGFDLEKLKLENQWRSDLLSLEYGFKQDLQNAQVSADLQGRYTSTYKDLLNQLNAILVDPNTDDATKRSMVNNYIKSIERMRNSLRAIGQKVPDFDFSDYYVG